MRRRRLWLTVLPVLVPSTVVLGGLGIDWAHPADRIVSGGRIWRCALVGGSWPVDGPAEVGLRGDLAFGRIGAVDEGTGWVAVVALQDVAGISAGRAAFVLGDGVGSRLGALDGAASAVATVRSSDGAGSHPAARRAAAECLNRHLPELSSTSPADPPASSTTPP